MQKHDILDKQDVKDLVNAFYVKVRNDEILGPVFDDFAKVDWETHLPKMYDFWNSLLFGSMVYKGQPFPKHATLPIQDIHFDRWVKLFTATVEERFTGGKAEEAKQRAISIAAIFKFKMGV